MASLVVWFGVGACSKLCHFVPKGFIRNRSQSHNRGHNKDRLKVRPRALTNAKIPPLPSIVPSQTRLKHFLIDTQIKSRPWIAALALVNCQLFIYVSVQMTVKAMINIVRPLNDAPLSDSIILSIRVTDPSVAATVSLEFRSPSCINRGVDLQ